MIFILSSNGDVSTVHVQYWLKHLNKRHIRINDTDRVTIKKMSLNKSQGDINLLITNGTKGFEIGLGSISSYWYRRGEINMPFAKYPGDTPSFYSLNHSLSKEINETVNYIHLYLKNKSCVNSFLDTEINKLHSLALAQACGLAIPDTLITTSKKELEVFYQNNKYKQIITKAIWNVIAYEHDNAVYEGMTKIFNYEALHNEIPDTFFPTLFQECIAKKYELRIFYLKGDFYGSAIFSQTDPTTSVDFRNYNHDKPNRVNPFKLPETEEAKLKLLMDKLDLNSGSIDMIVTKDNQYIFLEVNPLGQFGQVSAPCNYMLPKRIAESL